ncbi:hypothetical protein TNCV_282821 [Trichonephila clavipes]|nr:hypothetical protein TNCV_282821 [Trichonephila clavipes]
MVSFSEHLEKAGTGSDTYNVFKNEKILQPIPHTYIAFGRCCCSAKGFCDASHKKQKCLSYSSIAARIDRDPMTVCRIYGINGFRTVKPNAMLDLNGTQSLEAEKTGMLPAWS